MSPPHTPIKPIRHEADTTKRARFFYALQNQKKGQSFNELCAQSGINIPPSTGRYWRRQYEELGDLALRRTRRQSSRLGQPPKVLDADLKPIFDPQHPLHGAPFEAMNFELSSRQLHTRFGRFEAHRFKRRTASKISDKNKKDRIQYGHANGRKAGKNIENFWKWVYFTDEAHFNSKDLANYQDYELRRRGHPEDALPPQEIDQSSLNVTLHVAAGISYNHKGIFLFYNDPADPAIPKPRPPPKPRRSKYEDDNQWQKRLREFEASLPHDVEIKPKGNSMTQKFYVEKVLTEHVEHIKWLEAKYKRKFWFQEDNDPSHGNRSTDNVVARFKRASELQLLYHCAQSPDLNPIEAIWNIIKGRIRGRTFKTVAEFKAAILAEWKHITIAEIRRRISEMPKRCEDLIELKGARIKSKVW
jgi:DDE superfamily endonuclease